MNLGVHGSGITSATDLSLGIASKLVGCFFVAYRFILLKELDAAYDKVREEDASIDQDQWDKIFAVLKDDMYFYGKKYAIHKKDFYQYLTILPYTFFDTFSMYFIPFTLFSALNVVAILFYEILLVRVLSDPVDCNEWFVILCLTASSVVLAFFAPDTSTPLRESDHKIGAVDLSYDVGSIIWIVILFAAKIFSYFYLQVSIKEIVAKKDREEISDLYQPRPASIYNLMGPFHLGLNGAIWFLFINSLLNSTHDSPGSHDRGFQTAIVLIIGFVLGGIGCAWGAAHSYHDMIGELHSATVFPMFILLQSSLSVVTGIICFLEKPSDPALFWISCTLLGLFMMAFVAVMEYNEPVPKSGLYDNPLLNDSQHSSPTKQVDKV